MYYQKSNAIIFVYDITNIDSYKNLKKLYNEVGELVDIKKVITIIVGNKSDMYEKEVIKKNEAEQYAKSIQSIYRCVSAREGRGINELFDCVAKSLLNNDGKESKVEEPTKEKKEEFSLQNQSKKKKKKKCC
jgi:GTPase SAR1 family protein